MSRTGTYIRKLREKKGLTTRKLGQSIGYTNAAISMWERDKRRVDISALWRLISALDGDMRYALMLLALDAGIPEEVFTKWF